MELSFRYVAPPGPCGYLPDRRWRLEYEQFEALSTADYEQRLKEGWRRFGHTLFRPRCPECTACQSLRVIVERFQPDRSQRRVCNRNKNVIRLCVGEPQLSAEKLDLYDRFHDFQTRDKGWPRHSPKDPCDYAASFLVNPFPTQEWCYYLEDELVGVGYVDYLPNSLSAIYFFHDPRRRDRSLGTWNVLCVLQRAADLALPFVYLGYFVEGCRSMAYKARFQPHELLSSKDSWRSPLWSEK